jgi:RNA-binding protein
MLFDPTAIFRFRHAEVFARMADFDIRPTIMTSSNEDKKHLRRLGHDLKPVVTVAAKGLTDTVSAELERALSDHELIKVKLAVGDRDAKRAVSDTICQNFKAELVQSIGHILLIYRPAKSPNPKLSNLLRK